MTKKAQNHGLYIVILRRMTPEQRLRKAFELSEFSKQLFIHGLRRRFPEAGDEEFSKILRERLDKCRNSNY